MNWFRRTMSISICLYIFLSNFVNSSANIILNENIFNAFNKRNTLIKKNESNNVEILNYNVEVDDSIFNDNEYVKDESSKNGLVLTNSNIIYTINYSVANKDDYDNELNGDIFFKIKIDYNEDDLKISNVTSNNYEIQKDNSSQILLIKIKYNNENEITCLPSISSVSFSFTPGSKLAGEKITPDILAYTQDKEYNSENKIREVLVAGSNLSVNFNIESSSKYKTTKISADENSFSGVVEKKGLAGEIISGDISDYLIKIKESDKSEVGNTFLKQGDIINVDLICTSTANQKDVKTIVFDLISESDANIEIINIKQNGYITIQIKVNSDTPSFHVLALHSLNEKNYKEKFQLNISFTNLKINQQNLDINSGNFTLYRDYLSTGSWVTYHSLLKYNDKNNLDDGIINHLEMAYDSNQKLRTEDSAHILGLISAYKPMSARIPIGEVFYASGNLYTKNVNENSAYKSFDYICFFDSDIIEPYIEGESLVNNGDMESAVNTEGRTLESFRKQAEAYKGNNGEVITYYIGRNKKLTKKEQVSIEIKDSSLIYYKDYKKLLTDNKKCVGVCVSFRNGSINPVRRKNGDLYLFASALTPLVIKNHDVDSEKISSNITWTFAGSSNNLQEKSLENNYVNEITNPYKEYDYISSPMHLYFWCNNKSKSLYGIGNDKIFSSWNKWDYDDAYIESTVWGNSGYTIPGMRRDESFDRYGTCVKGVRILPKIKIDTSKKIITNEDRNLDLLLNIDYSSLKNINNNESTFEVSVSGLEFLKIEKENSIFINGNLVDNFDYKNGVISIDIIKALNSKPDTILIKSNCYHADNSTYEIIASIKEKNSSIIPSIFNDTLDRKNIFVRKNNYQSIYNNSKIKEETPNNEVAIDTHLLAKDSSNSKIEVITFIANKEDNISIINGDMLKRYLVIDVSNLSEKELLSLDIKGTNNIYKSGISYANLKDYSSKMANVFTPIDISNVSIPSNNILSYELPLDIKAISISCKSLSNKELDINYRIIYKDNNNGKSIYIQNSYLINNDLELYTRSPKVKICISSNYYNIKYVTDGNGEVLGENTESVEELGNPVGRNEKANDKYIFNYWTCNKDIELKSGEIIETEKCLNMEQIKNSIIRDHVIFTAHYRPVPILSVDKKSSKESYNSSEQIDYIITISQIAKDTFATNIDIEDCLEDEGIVFRNINSDSNLNYIYKKRDTFKANYSKLDYNETIIISASVKILNEEDNNIFSSDKAINKVYVSCDEYEKNKIERATSKAEPYIYHKINIKVINGNILGIERKFKVMTNETCEYVKDDIVSGSNQVFYYEANDNYYLNEIKVDGNTVNKEKNMDFYVFENITKNHSIEVYYREIPDLNIEKKASKDLLDIQDNRLEYILTIKKDETNKIASNLYLEDRIEDGMIIDMDSINIDRNDLKYTITGTNKGFTINFNEDVLLDNDINIKYIAYIDDYSKIINNHKDENRFFVENYAKVEALGAKDKEVYSYTLLNRPSMILEKSQINDSINMGEYNQYRIIIKQDKRGMIAKNVIVEDIISDSLEIIPKSINIKYIEDLSSKNSSIKPSYELLSIDKKKITLNIKNLSSGTIELVYEAKGIKADSGAENVVNIINNVYDISNNSSTKTQIFDNVKKSDKIVKTGDILIYIITIIMCIIIIINNNIDMKKTSIRKK